MLEAPPRYQDFRELLDKERGIDAVIVGTPDHTHATIAMAAMQLGKHDRWGSSDSHQPPRVSVRF